MRCGYNLNSTSVEWSPCWTAGTLMDLRRANRNLQLVLDGQEQPDQDDEAGAVDSSNAAERDLVDTQVPEELEFSSSPTLQSRDGVFVSTQVQSRLDDALQEEALQEGLKRFKYDDGQDNEQATTVRVARKRKVTRKVQQKRLDDFGQSKAEQLLKRLSGKHSKVTDIMELQRRKRKLGARSASQYDTYNAEEWHYIHKKLLQHLPQDGPEDVKEVFYYLYGPDHPCSEKDLWGASQIPPNVETPRAEMKGKFAEAAESQDIKVLTLSQVLSDNGNAGPDESGADEVSMVPDSMDEDSICIPIDEVDRASTQFYTPRTSLADEIIDPTQESFKVVKSLISPLKDEETPLVQVPATRTSTILVCAKQPLPSVTKNLLKIVVPREQLGSLQENLSCDFLITNEDQCVMSDIDLEDCDPVPVYLQLRTQQSPNKKVVVSSSRFATQSAQKLRQSIKAIGLKPSRSKSQMIASLEAASQELKSFSTEQEQRHMIYENLTKLVYSCPSLLERVYTFQPILLDDLLARLIEANPFIDHVDEPTIRTWAEEQGICLTSGG